MDGRGEKWKIMSDIRFLILLTGQIPKQFTRMGEVC